MSVLLYDPDLESSKTPRTQKMRATYGARNCFRNIIYYFPVFTRMNNEVENQNHLIGVTVVSLYNTGNAPVA